MTTTDITFNRPFRVWWGNAWRRLVLSPSRSWRSRAVVVLVLVVGYTGLFYGMAHTRAPRSNTNGRPMLTPVISEVGMRRGDVVAAKPLAMRTESQSTPPARHWIFPPIDVWPSAPGWSPTLSEFTPVTDARPDPRDAQTLPSNRPVDKPAARRSALRMVRWLRPEYPVDWAVAGMEGSVVLNLLIDPQGQPIEVELAQGSGSSELDQATLRAAQSWRFAPPLFNSQPVEVWGRIEVRYKSESDTKVQLWTVSPAEGVH